MAYFMQPISITDATFTVTKAHSGIEFYLNRAGGSTITLPAPAVGLKYRFIVATAPTTAYTLNTNGGANIIKLSVNELETDTGDDGPSDDDADIVSFVANIALAGDFIDMRSDGTYWYAVGQARADGAVTSGTT